LSLIDVFKAAGYQAMLLVGQMEMPRSDSVAIPIVVHDAEDATED